MCDQTSQHSQSPHENKDTHQHEMTEDPILCEEFTVTKDPNMCEQLQEAKDTHVCEQMLEKRPEETPKCEQENTPIDSPSRKMVPVGGRTPQHWKPCFEFSFV